MNMIEKVARAMIAKHYGPEGSEEFEKILRNFGDTYLESAAAAIEAIRQPTEAMMEAVRSPCFPGDTPTYQEAWEYMIDAALKEETQKNP